MHYTFSLRPTSAYRPGESRLVRKALTAAMSIVFLSSVSLPSVAFAQNVRTRVVDTACGTHSAELAARAVGEALLGAAIQNTLGRIGAALRAAGEASTKSTVAHRNTEVAPGMPAKCLFIARGRWTTSNDEHWKDKSGMELKYEGVEPAEFLQTNPDLALRVAIDTSSDFSALKLKPVFLEYGRHLADTKGGFRGLSLEVAFHGPGQASDHKDAVGASLVLGDFEPGHRYDLVSGGIEKWEKRKEKWEPASGTRLPLQEESHWFPTYAPTAVAGADEGARNQRRPRIISATIAETRAARPMLLFLADIFDASKDEIQGSLEVSLLKSKREEAQLAAAKEKNDQLVELVTAVADAEIAEALYCAMDEGGKDSEYLKARKEMFVAMNKANFVAGSLGQPLPFTSISIPKAESPDTWRKCPGI